MPREDRQAARLTEVVALETALFEAYGALLTALPDRVTRERLMACQARSARARGRLMATLERLAISHRGPGPGIESDPEALVAAEADAIEAYGELRELAEAGGDTRLEALARAQVEDHEWRRAAIQRIGD